MHSGNWLKVALAMAAVASVASACGGSTSGGQSARGELEQTAAARCADACETIVRCELSGCSCECDCAPEEPDCCEGGCECEQPTEASCTADCSEAVDEVLRESPGCEDEMLALLDCLPGPTCGEDLCESEQQGLEECQDRSDGSYGSEAKPTVPGPPAGEGCAVSAGSGAAGPLAPGDMACEVEWSECSDGNEYRIQCIQQSETTLSCTCFVNGAVTAGASGAFVCGAGDMSQLCGWTL